MPISGNLHILLIDNSSASASTEVVILLAIISSINSKKKYFANSCSLNSGSIEVEGFLPTSYADNIHQRKNNTRTTAIGKKTIQYSYINIKAQLNICFKETGKLEQV